VASEFVNTFGHHYDGKEGKVTGNGRDREIIGGECQCYFRTTFQPPCLHLLLYADATKAKLIDFIHYRWLKDLNSISICRQGEQATRPKSPLSSVTLGQDPDLEDQIRASQNPEDAFSPILALPFSSEAAPASPKKGKQNLEALIFSQLKSIQSIANRDPKSAAYVTISLQGLLKETGGTGSIPGESTIATGAQKGRRKQSWQEKSPKKRQQRKSTAKFQGSS